MNYVDLATTVSGDLYFLDAAQNNTLRLSFDLSFDNNEQLILSFNHNSLALPEINKESLKLTFDCGSQNFKHKASCVYDKEVLKNRIEYIIRTTLTDLKKNTSFGSDLELYMHKNIRNSTVISNVESVISSALSGVVDAMSVKVSPYVSHSQNGYFQGITIDIYSYGNIITSYTV